MKKLCCNRAPRRQTERNRSLCSAGGTSELLRAHPHRHAFCFHGVNRITYWEIYVIGGATRRRDGDTTIFDRCRAPVRPSPCSLHCVAKPRRARTSAITLAVSCSSSTTRMRRRDVSVRSDSPRASWFSKCSVMHRPAREHDSGCYVIWDGARGRYVRTSPAQPRSAYRARRMPVTASLLSAEAGMRERGDQSRAITGVTVPELDDAIGLRAPARGDLLDRSEQGNCSGRDPCEAILRDCDELLG